MDLVGTVAGVGHPADHVLHMGSDDVSYKLTCPGCDAYTSAVFHAYEDGRPCPYCNAKLGAASAQYYRQLPDVHP
jgi:hypothetical protein